MSVNADSPRRVEYRNRTFLFCGDDCVTKFRANPERYVNRNPAHAGSHAQLQSDGPNVQLLPIARPLSGGANADDPAVGAAGGARSAVKVGTATRWTCPMHPEIVRDAPGACPLCGMALEPLIAM